METWFHYYNYYYCAPYNCVAYNHQLIFLLQIMKQEFKIYWNTIRSDKRNHEMVTQLKTEIVQHNEALLNSLYRLRIGRGFFWYQRRCTELESEGSSSHGQSAIIGLVSPIKPLMWTKTQPGISAALESSSSLRPLHCSGRAFRFSNLSGATATAWTLHCFPRSS